MEVRPHSATLSKAITFLIIMGIFAGSAPAGTSIVNSKHDFSFSSTGTPFAGQFQIGPPNTIGIDIDEICVFCHTPHSASQDAQTGTLLWNRIPSNYSYKTYSSASMTNPAPDSLNSGKPTGISMMCMSCHDGVTSIAANVGNNAATPTLLNAPGSGNPQVSVVPAALGGTLPEPGAIGNVFQGVGALGWGPNIGNIYPGGPSNIVDLSNDHPISFNMPTGRLDLQDPTLLRLFGGTGGRRIECATCHSVHNPLNEPFLAMSNSQSLMCRHCHIK